jgi:hypothetical protein
MLVLWLTTTTGRAHYFLPFFKALKSAPVILFAGAAALAIFFCFGDNFLEPFLQAPLHPAVEQPHPQPLHIYLLAFFLGFDLATPLAGTQFGTFLPFFIFIPT